MPSLKLIFPLLMLAIGTPASPPEVPAQAPLTPSVRAIGERAIAAQHADDAAGETYERIEHHVESSDSPAPQIVDDKEYRVVPTWTGTLKLLLRDHGKPVAPGVYRQELETWQSTLQMALDPNSPALQGAREKAAKRKQERAELVNATRDAFITTYGGVEMKDGYSCDRLDLTPNPKYHPRSALTGFLTHAKATIWVDRSTGHLVEGEGDIVQDISFGAGILGKIYKGGHLFIKQQPVAKDVWLPSYIQYDLAGRKFLFGFNRHEKIELSHYRNLQTVKKALAVARDDIARSGSFAGNP